MPRRPRIRKRVILPDPVYTHEGVAKFVNVVMQRGKRSVAEHVFYTSMDRIKRVSKKDPIEVFDTAIKNATPVLEVKPRRIGGATYQVPVEVRPRRATTLSIRWLVGYSRQRREKTMAQRLANELLDASNSVGAAVKRREDMHKMAESNKAFAHYRW